MTAAGPRPALSKKVSPGGRYSKTKNQKGFKNQTNGGKRSKPSMVNDSQKQNGSVSAPAKLKQSVMEQRDLLHSRMTQTDGMKSKLQEMRLRASAMTERKDIRIRNGLCREIVMLEQEIEMIESGEEMRNFDVLSRKYIHAMDRQQDIAVMRNKTRSFQMQQGKSEGLMDFLKSSHEPLTATSILNEYEAEMGYIPPTIQVINRDMCTKCDVPMILMAQDARLSCQKCGTTVQYMDATSASMAYGEEVEFTFFSYKRLNHFNEWLNQFQAKETTDVPREVYEDVTRELIKAGIKSPEEITKELVRCALKKLILRKYYEHVVLITVRLSGKPPPRMSPEQEERCRLMFLAIQVPFAKYCPSHRKNFLSYSYVLFKFCELLGYTEFMPCFPLLKGKEKLLRQDSIFEKICKDLGWTFIPSSGSKPCGMKPESCWKAQNFHASVAKAQECC